MSAPPAIRTGISSPYRLGTSNSPIPVFHGNMTLADPKSSISGPGTLTISWLPAPRVQFETKSVGIVGTEPVDIRVRGALSSAQGYVTQSRFSTAGDSFTHGFVRGQLRRGSGSNLSKMLFHVSNFPQYLGTPVVRRVGGRLVSRAEIAAGDWSIDLDCREDLKAIQTSLAKTGGYAITHVGALTRKDGGTFGWADGEDVLEALGTLLTFACGARCYPFLAIGYDTRGRGTWRSWSEPRSTLWSSRFSWFVPNDADGLNRAFSGLFARWSDPHQREIVRRVVYLLAEANRHGVEPALIIAQAALELMAWQVLVNEAKTLSKPGFERLEAADKLRLLLTTSRVPLGPPISLGGLAGFATATGAADGPQALTLIRNRWVHPPRSGILTASGPEIMDAWLLSLWYLDLVILKWLGFEGDHSPRVRPGTAEPVPWM